MLDLFKIYRLLKIQKKQTLKTNSRLEKIMSLFYDVRFLYLYQLQDSLIGVFICLNSKEIVLISCGDHKDGAPVVCVFKVQVQSFDP